MVDHRPWKDRSSDGGLQAIQAHKKSWAARAKVASGLLTTLPISSVYDFGCGQMLLKNYLPPTMPYYGYDVILSPGVRQLDLSGPLPDINPAPNSAAVFIGVLESLGPELDKVLDWVRSQFDYVLIYYTDHRWQKRPTWATRLPKQEMLNKIQKIGSIVQSAPYGEHTMYVIKSNKGL